MDNHVMINLSDNMTEKNDFDVIVYVIFKTKCVITFG